MRTIKRVIAFCILLSCTLHNIYAQNNYQNFKVSVYSRSYETQKMADRDWIEPIWNEIEKQVDVDKIYLETHRDLLVVDQKTLDKAKAFFKERGIETAGGITLTIDEGNFFQTFCYSKPEDRQKVKEIVEYTAKNFDEVILDDFFFTNCKCDRCIEAKGDRSWTEYRLELMDEAARELIIKPAKVVNPDVKIVIKFPNWYEHFQGLGFNLESEPKIFDGIYTGTETRDPSSNQHLQQYHGYSIFRYFENLKPNGNGGGWVDTGGTEYLDRYGEQLWITLFAKAPEITLFDLRQMQRPVNDELRAKWQEDYSTSFDFDEMMKPYKGENGTMVTPSTFARAAGYTFENVDQFLGQLGEPVGIKSYKPFHSTGEDFLQSYLGMIGIPMDIVPEFPKDEDVVLLTETAKYDDDIVNKIKGQLQSGRSVVITSGLVKALENKGLGNIVELRYTGRKALVNTFRVGREIYHSEEKMLLPEIRYLTNDSWEKISALDGTNGWPLLHAADYSQGMLYVLTIPDNFTDLYELPEEVLTEIREVMMGSQPVVLEAPGKVSLFQYDNNTFIVESFRDEPVDVNITANTQYSRVKDLVDNSVVEGKQRAQEQGRWGRITGEAKTVFPVKVNPHSYRVFKLE